MIEPLAVAVHAVSLAGDSAQMTTALVVGAGMIGLLVLQALREAGCSRVIVADIDDTRSKLAQQLGATETVNAKTADTGARSSAHHVRCRRGCRARGRRQHADCQNRDRKRAQRRHCRTDREHRAVRLRFRLQKVVSRQIRLQGSAASSGEYPQCIELLARGAVNVKPLISVVAPLAGRCPAGSSVLHAREPNLMKVILTPTRWAATVNNISSI